METRDAVPAAGAAPRTYCPRCRRDVPFVTFEEAALLSGDSPTDHVVILPSGEARVCLAPQASSIRRARRAQHVEGR